MELERHYSEHMHKITITDTEYGRGVVATEDIKVGDILLDMPSAETMTGSHVDLTYKLIDTDNAYTRSFPIDMTSFPVLWSAKKLEGAKHSALADITLSRKKTLLAENTKKHPLFLFYRLIVGSRGFATNQSTVTLVPVADMFNHANEPNVDWNVKNGVFYMRAVADIAKGEECFDTYGSNKTNYENIVFYGMTLTGNIHNDITYELFDVPPTLQDRLDSSRFAKTIEFELCGSYSRGTVEIFSFVRYLCRGGQCPMNLSGYYLAPNSRLEELRVVGIFIQALDAAYRRKVHHLNNLDEQVSAFIGTELNVIMRWTTLLKSVHEILKETNQKRAKKMVDQCKPSIYINEVVRKLVNKKKSYV